jgi:hypothetical protein
MTNELPFLEPINRRTGEKSERASTPDIEPAGPHVSLIEITSWSDRPCSAADGEELPDRPGRRAVSARGMQDVSHGAD